MKRIMVYLALAPLLFIAGCVTPPSSEQIASLDYGTPPQNHEATIKKYFSDLLFDPYSAQYEFEPPQKQWRKEAPIAGGRTYAGYMVLVSVNAKNRLGGYVGKKRYGFMINDERIVKVVDEFALGNTKMSN